MADTKFRTERDSMGELKVPADALYGAQTQRAVDNFPISNLRMPRAFIRALGLIKAACAKANTELDLLDGKIAAATKRNIPFDVHRHRWHIFEHINCGAKIT